MEKKKKNLRSIKETSKRCLDINDSYFQLISNNLSKAIIQLEICTETLLEWTKSNKKRSILFSASDYLELFGIIAGSHYLAKGALSENDINEKSTGARKKLALFFTNQILIDSESLSKSICSNNEELDNFLEDF